MILVQNIGRILRWKSLYFSMVLLGFITWFYSAAEMRTTDRLLEHQLGKNELGYEANIQYLEDEERPIRYLSIGDDQLPLIVFIHGAPSSMSFWKNLLRDHSLLKNAKLLAIDRPGYGYSGYGQPEISVQQQAVAIARVIEKFRGLHQQIILHGSSYGGTVAARVAMDYPDLVDGLLLQSSSLKAHAEKTFPISYPTSHWSLRWAIPGALRTANAEKLSHHLSLEAMASRWDRIKAATIVLHGYADGLIYPDNAYYAFERLNNAAYRDIRMFEGRRHDLLWTKTGVLKSSLLKLIEVSKP